MIGILVRDGSNHYIHTWGLVFPVYDVYVELPDFEPPPGRVCLSIEESTDAMLVQDHQRFLPNQEVLGGMPLGEACFLLGCAGLMPLSSKNPCN